MNMDLVGTRLDELPQGHSANKLAVLHLHNLSGVAIQAMVSLLAREEQSEPHLNHITAHVQLSQEQKKDITACSYYSPPCPCTNLFL